MTSEPTTDPKRGKGFVYQAAQYSIAAPVVALGLGLCLTGALKESGDAGIEWSARMALAVLNMAIITSGLIMGLVALAAVPKRGAKGLLVRGIVGVVLSGGILALVLWTILGGMSLGPAMAKRLVGNWKETSGIGVLRLHGDGTGVWEMQKPMANTFPGKWKVLRQQDATKPLVLRFEFDKPPEFAPELKGMGWEIEHVEAGRLDLNGRDATGKQTMEIFTRSDN
ncbi:MAG: hypothetical protein FWD61_04025 [Phycisphaerales bacterium]|nr:hypothetical protein [Phycisphaerales bacterium]